MERGVSSHADGVRGPQLESDDDVYLAFLSGTQVNVAVLAKKSVVAKSSIARSLRCYNF